MKLENDLNQIWLIYVEARQSLEIYKYIRSENPTHIFWRQIRYMGIKNCFIELDKLISDSKNQKFRLSKFINKLKPDGYYKKYNFPFETIQKWERNMSDLKSQTDIIETLRSKKYAHTDREFNYSPNLDFDEIERLFDLIEEILIKVHKICLDKMAITSLSFKAENLKFIDQIQKYKELRKQEVFEKLGKK